MSEKAFDFASDLTKQLITLSVGVIALTVTFVKDVKGTAHTLLVVSWAIYLVSILFGVATMMALAGNLERPGDNAKPSIYAGNIRMLAGIQVVAFAVATGLTIWFGAKAL